MVGTWYLVLGTWYLVLGTWCLVLGPVPGCDVVTFVGQFKNLTQRAFWGLGRRGKIWQQSFWDHLLRAEEDAAVVLTYILNNPVRAGLVASWRDYPFAGSLNFTLESAARRRGASPRPTVITHSPAR